MPPAILLLIIALLWAAPIAGSPCRHNDWQPTYVHDLLNPDVPYCVMPDGSFVALTGDWTNQSGPGMCSLFGVLDRRGFTNCFEYTRIQCGCDMQSLVNVTCRRFLTWRGGGTIRQAYSWVSVGEGDHPGQDVDSSEGPIPDPRKAKAGHTAFCWDGVQYNNIYNPGRAFCTYKNVPVDKIQGGRNTGMMYTAVPR